MKASQIREISIKELHIKLRELKELIFRYRFQLAQSQLDNPRKYREAKKDIARIKTILKQKTRINDDSAKNNTQNKNN